jgi:uncharacterized membrane protein (UPF0127 family)
MRSDRFVPAFFFIFLFLAGCVSAGERVCVREACFSVEVMRTDAERAQGLMFRTGLDQGKGMFFVFDTEDIYPFWMKNTLFAIDIIWLDKDKRVVDIASDVPPCRTTPCPVYTPSAKVLYVLEIPAGDAARYGIKPGDSLR